MPGAARYDSTPTTFTLHNKVLLFLTVATVRSTTAFACVLATAWYVSYLCFLLQTCVWFISSGSVGARYSSSRLHCHSCPFIALLILVCVDVLFLPARPSFTMLVFNFISITPSILVAGARMVFVRMVC